MRTRTALAVAVAAGALALAGCGDDGDGAATPSAAAPPPPAAGVMLADAGLSVAEARAAEGGVLLAVRAHVVVDDGGAARLCDAVAESWPPSCAGASMVGTGLPPELVAGLRADGGRRWSDGPVQLLGRVRDGAFVNDPMALAAG